MRALSAVLGLVAVTAFVYLLIARQEPDEAALKAQCADLERKLASLEDTGEDGPSEARSVTKSVLESLVADCRRSGLGPEG